MGKSNTHTPKRGVAIPDSSEPVRNPAQIPARRRARYRCVSHLPWLSGRGARLAASASCTPILLNVPVTKVRLTYCAPTRDSAVFMAPIAKLTSAMGTQPDENPSCVKPTIKASKAATTPKTSRRVRRTPECAARSRRGARARTINTIASAECTAAQQLPCPIR